jgi:hypothetical protein
MKEHKLSPLQRVLLVMQYLYRRGGNKESVNNVYRNIIKKKYEKIYTGI